MIVGLGTDIVSIERIAKVLDKNKEQFINRICTKNEKKELVKCNDLPMKLAKLWSVKEAAVKALGTGLRGMQLKDICVKSDALGKPELCLYGSALDLFNKSGANSIHISLSHETEYSVACVILECK